MKKWINFAGMGSSPMEKSERIVVNQPLDLELKTLETDHPWFAERKLTPETISRFGLGFCKRGSFAGRIAVPLVDDEAQLVAYAGLALKDGGEGGNTPRYLFPASREHEGVRHVFDPGKFLYNGFRIGKAVTDLIVVQECHTVWNLWQSGYANVVALMQNNCSEDQASQICSLTRYDGRISLVTGPGHGDELCAKAFLVKVGSGRFCKWSIREFDEPFAADDVILSDVRKPG